MESIEEKNKVCPEALCVLDLVDRFLTQRIHSRCACLE